MSCRWTMSPRWSNGCDWFPLSLSIMSSRTALSIQPASIRRHFRFPSCSLFHINKDRLSFHCYSTQHRGSFQQHLLIPHFQTFNTSKVWHRHLSTSSHLSQSIGSLLSTCQVHSNHFWNHFTRFMSTHFVSVVCLDTINLLANKLGRCWSHSHHSLSHFILDKKCFSCYCDECCHSSHCSCYAYSWNYLLHNHLWLSYESG